MIDYLRRLKKVIKDDAVNKRVFPLIRQLSSERLCYYSVNLKREIDESELLECVDAGDVVVAKGIAQTLGLIKDLEALALGYFELDLGDLSSIHTNKSVEEIVDLTLKAKSSYKALAIQASLMARVLSVSGSNFYIEMNPNIRLHLPYSYVKNKESFIEEKMGRGKLNPHGQHKDSWRYHPENTINVWLALTDANPNNGLSLLPNSTDYFPRFNEAEQEIETGVKTYPSQQYLTDLSLGDALIFRAELLHGSILNTTVDTRVAFSMRCTVSEPEFHKRYQYNYVRCSAGNYSSMNFKKLMANCDFEPKSESVSFPHCESVGSGIDPVEYDESSIRLVVDGEEKLYPRRCPHAGADLLLGELDYSGKLICPNHRMCFKGKRVKEKMDGL